MKQLKQSPVAKIILGSCQLHLIPIKCHFLRDIIQFDPTDHDRVRSDRAASQFHVTPELGFHARLQFHRMKSMRKCGMIILFGMRIR